MSSVLFLALLFGSEGTYVDHHHRGHHHHHHHGMDHAGLSYHHHDMDHVLDKLKKLTAHLAEKTKAAAAAPATGHLLANGPLPAGFAEEFSKAVSDATGADAHAVQLVGSKQVVDQPGVVELGFTAPSEVVKMVEYEAADPDSKLASGTLHSFLFAKDQGEPSPAPPPTPSAQAEEPTPVSSKGIDIDTQLPYGDLEPFGREDTAQELTESSVTESNEMVDQLERAEVAEEKRSVFRALTRLRGAAITSFDGVARSQTGNIDEYNKVHKWRNGHPMHHLADEESDVTKWAFPSNADLLQVPLDASKASPSTD